MVTAILLLLSLPVLAGEFHIAPALNLAVCGEISEVTAIAYTLPVIIQDNPQVTSRNFMSIRNLNDCAPGLSNRIPFSSLGSYLAGLIEADGTIVVPTTERSPKGKLNYASIQISFPTKDFPLAAALRLAIGHGSIAKKKIAAAYVLSINNQNGLIVVASLINGLLRTPKMTDYNDLIVYLNRVAGSDILLPKARDTSELGSNA